MNKVPYRKYTIKEIESHRKTVVVATDEFGNETTIETWYWVVHGRQGAWQKANNKYKRRETA